MFRTLFHLVAVAALFPGALMLFPGGMAQAAEADKPAVDKPAVDKPAARNGEPNEGEDAEPTIADPLEEMKKIKGKMEDVEIKLAEKNVGEPTSVLQKEIIDCLANLISFGEKQAKQQARKQAKQQGGKPAKQAVPFESQEQTGEEPNRSDPNRMGGPSDPFGRTPESPGTSIGLGIKEYEGGRQLDDEAIPEGFESLLRRFFKVMGESKEG